MKQSRPHIVLTLLGSLLVGSFNLSAQTTYFSTNTGSWSDPNTWGGSGTPGNNDNAVITDNTVVFHALDERILDLEIEPLGQLVSDTLLRIRGDYIINGIHSGKGRVLFVSNGTSISGSGSMETTSIVRINRKTTILAGSDITRDGGALRCPNSDTLFNLGRLTMMNNLTANETGTFVNGENAMLFAHRKVVENGTLVASANGNTVIYARTGGGDQVIKVPHDGYFNLTIDGTNTNSIKSLEGATDVIGDFIIENSSFSHTDTFTLRVGGDFSFNNGSYDAAEGRVVFNGTDQQRISGQLELNDVVLRNTGVGATIDSDSLTLNGYMAIEDGLFITNGRLIINSDMNHEGAIGEIATGSQVIGDVVARRYIDQGATNWRFMGSPITNATFLDWKDDFIMSGFPGAHAPGTNFVSIYGYDETVPGVQDSGFYTIEIDDNINPGEGYWVFCGDSLTGTNPFTIDLIGPINQGTFNFNVTYTSSAGETEDGWNLIANPYPAALDWDGDGWTKFNVRNAIYTWNTDLGEYSSYVNGEGANNGLSEIPVGQGFYVQTDGASPILLASESSKKDTVVPFLRNEGPDLAVVRLKLMQDGMQSETVVRVNDVVSNPFDRELEAYYISPILPKAQMLFSETNGERFSINAMEVINRDSLSVVALGNAGIASIHFDVAEYKGSFCFGLYNPESNTYFRLKDEGEIELNIPESGSLELVLHIARTGSNNTEWCGKITDISPIGEDQDGFYYTAGRILFSGTRPGMQDYEIYSAAGSLVMKGTIDSELNLADDLTAGVYLFKSGDTVLKFVFSP